MISQVPYLLLVWFGSYALGSISYDMLVFRECPEAADELARQIEIAKADLKARGFSDYQKDPTIVAKRYEGFGKALPK